MLTVNMTWRWHGFASSYRSSRQIEWGMELEIKKSSVWRNDKYLFVLVTLHSLLPAPLVHNLQAHRNWPRLPSHLQNERHCRGQETNVVAACVALMLAGWSVPLRQDVSFIESRGRNESELREIYQQVSGGCYKECAYHKYLYPHLWLAASYSLDVSIIMVVICGSRHSLYTWVKGEMAAANSYCHVVASLVWKMNATGIREG